MLTNESFLRNIHVGMLPVQRLALEGVGFSLDALGYAYSRLRDAAGTFAALSQEDFKDAELSPLFVNAWAIADHTHLARKLLESLAFDDPPIKAFIAETVEATKLRNKLHHIHSNLLNLAKMAVGAPLFGALSFDCLTDDDVKQLPDGTLQLLGWRGIVVNAGKPVEMIHTIAEGTAGVKIEFPVGRFLLQAFDRTVNLSELVFSAQRLVEFFDTKMKARIEAKVRKAALIAGLDPEEELKKTGLSLVWELRIAMVADEQSPPTSKSETGSD